MARLIGLTLESIMSAWSGHVFEPVPTTKLVRFKKVHSQPILPVHQALVAKITTVTMQAWCP